MAKLPRIIPVTDLRQDAAEVVKQVHVSQEPMVITQRGRPAAVLLREDRVDLLAATRPGDPLQPAARSEPVT